MNEPDESLYTATIIPVPAPPTRTLVRLTSFETGDVVLVDPDAVTEVTRWNGSEPRTVIHVKGVYGPTPVRETPTEVHNLLSRAGVRIIGSDDIGYGEFVAAMSPNAAAFTASALDTIVTPDRAQPWLCDQCGHATDDCIAKGVCDRSIVPPPAPEPGKGAR